MERNTATILENLLVDDRFFFAGDKAREVWQVISKGPFTTYVNQVFPNGNKRFKYDERKSNDRQVVYLRNAKESSNQKQTS